MKQSNVTRLILFVMSTLLVFVGLSVLCLPACTADGDQLVARNDVKAKKVVPQKIVQPTPEQLQRRQQFLEDAMRSIPPDDKADKTLSPYFFVFSDDPSTDRLPLKKTRADVNIAGVIARTKITQEYRNEGKNVLEAIYIFPMSTRAAVYGMKMTIGDRVIEAVIKEKQQARKDYEVARQQGKTASLLEQQRPNVFQMNVANILPKDIVKVEVFYTELLVPEDAVYEYVYPTVVGPRYSTVKEDGAPADEAWVKNPYTHEGEPATFTFEMDLTINSGMPISRVTCPSHDTGIEFTGKQSASITIPQDSKAGTKDVVVQYVLAGDTIEEGLLLYEGKDENFFLMMMEPPQRVKTKEIVPREYIFVLDVSGSMHGYPLETAKALLADLFTQMNSGDYFNILFFSGGNFVLSKKSLPATKANKQKGLEAISRQRGGGGTQLLPALKTALDLPRKEGISTNIVVVTDGYVTVEKTAFEVIRKNLGIANLWSFGIGSSVNRYIIEGMARAGMGEPLIILNPKDAKQKSAKFKKYIESPVLTNIKVNFSDFDAYDVEPVAVPDLFAKRPIIVYGKYRGRPTGAVVVTGKSAAGSYKKTLKPMPTDVSPKNEALRYLWARQMIMQLDDMNNLAKTDERVKMVTNLGLKYNLMTQYTSFVAIDNRIRTNEKGETVKVPLPMPEGVSDSAVGQGIALAPAKKSRGAYGIGASGKMGMHSRMKPIGGGLGERGRGFGRGGTALGVSEESPESRIVDERSILGKADGSSALGSGGLGKRSSGKVKIVSVHAKGSLSKAVSKKIILRHMNQIKHNFAKALKTNPKLAGAISFKIEVNKDGKVTSVKVASDGIEVKKLSARILVHPFKRMIFPKSKSGGTTIEVTFKYTP